MKPATAQEGIALLRTAELHLHTVQLCIDQLTVLEACAALRTLAVRLQELSLRAGESCDAPAMADVADEMAVRASPLSSQSFISWPGSRTGSRMPGINSA
jgi:hypothetical protein